MDEAWRRIEENGGAGLPHRNHDPILRLVAHYFEPADYMLEQFMKLDRKAGTSSGLSHAKVIERRYFLMVWLSSLYVVMEGVEALPLEKELRARPLDIPDIALRIPPLMEEFGEHRDALRLLRNAQSHFQETAQKHVQFVAQRSRIDWALGIQGKLDRLFREYRIQSSVIYAMAGRKDELQLTRRKPPLSGKMRLAPD